MGVLVAGLTVGHTRARVGGRPDSTLGVSAPNPLSSLKRPELSADSVPIGGLRHRDYRGDHSEAPTHGDHAEDYVQDRGRLGHSYSSIAARMCTGATVSTDSERLDR